MITQEAKLLFKRRHFDYPKKHFVFGDLRVISNSRTFRWDYHVALIIKVNNIEYILDPAVSRTPIERWDWYKIISQDILHITGFVTCNVNTFFPGDQCLYPWNDYIKSQEYKEKANEYLDMFLEL